jgi:hypothetical protein
MIRLELGVPLATTSANTRKGRTPILRVLCFVSSQLGAGHGTPKRAMGMLISLLATLPSIARAAEADAARTVVVVYEPRAEAVSQRLRQEIEALGFQVDLKLESSPELPLEALALDARAVAAIRVKPLDAGGVEMTVLDRATGKTVHRELTRVVAADPAGEELIATRTVELFRASLMELNADHPSRGEVRPSQPVVALVHREEELQVRGRSGTLSLAAGPALLLMPEWRPSVQFWVEAAWVSKSGFGLSAAVFSPLSAAHLTEQEGAVELSATSYRLAAVWDSDSDSARVSARLSAGWSLASVSARGDASSPYVGLQADALAWSPWLGASGRLHISNHVALLAQVSGALALPRETIRFAGRDVADFARPACWLGFGPELSWP